MAACNPWFRCLLARSRLAYVVCSKELLNQLRGLAALSTTARFHVAPRSSRAPEGNILEPEAPTVALTSAGRSLCLVSAEGRKESQTGSLLSVSTPPYEQRFQRPLMTGTLWDPSPHPPSTSSGGDSTSSLPATAPVQPEGPPETPSVKIDISKIQGTENARDGSLALLFTCCKCNTRAAKKFSKVAYYNGVVIIRCPGCKSLHLVADRLKWFGDEESDIESILAAKGESIVKSLTEARFLDIEGIESKS